jgi:hypothetical protein
MNMRILRTNSQEAVIQISVRIYNMAMQYLERRQPTGKLSPLTPHLPAALKV